MEARNEPRPLVGSIGNLAKVSGNFFLENVSKSHRYILKFKIHVSIFVNIYIYIFFMLYTCIIYSIRGMSSEYYFVTFVRDKNFCSFSYVTSVSMLYRSKHVMYM